MTITDTITESEIFDAEEALRADRDSIDLELQHHARRRRTIARRVDAEISRGLNRAYRQALETVEETKSQIVSRREILADLAERQMAGDRTVTAGDLRTVKEEIETLENYSVSDAAAFRKAEEAWLPYAADNHLAEFAADALERVVDVPVIIRTDSDDAPNISPCIILSQRTPTKGYGLLAPSGKVEVKVVGEPEIDWRVVQFALEDTGSEVKVSTEQIMFHRVSFPLPVLASPSRGEVGRWSSAFVGAWRTHVEVYAHAARMRAAGYAYNGETGWKAFSSAPKASLTWGDGAAIGHVKLSLATTEGLSVPSLVEKVRELVEIFKSENVGTHTEAGEIVNIALTEGVAGDRNQWPGVFYNRPPQTVEVTIRLDYRYASPDSGTAED